VAALAGATKDPDLEVREAAVTSLSHLGSSAKSSLSALEESLRDPEASVRLLAAMAIQKIDPQSKSYATVILDSLNAGDGPTFLDVGQMGSAATWAVPTLIKLLSHPRTGIRALAARTLGDIGSGAIDAQSALKQALRDPNPAVRNAAERALNRIRP
jgi:HEAT repeat protein